MTEETPKPVADQAAAYAQTALNAMLDLFTLGVREATKAAEASHRQASEAAGPAFASVHEAVREGVDAAAEASALALKGTATVLTRMASAAEELAQGIRPAKTDTQEKAKED